MACSTWAKVAVEIPIPAIFRVRYSLLDLEGGDQIDISATEFPRRTSSTRGTTSTDARARSARPSRQSNSQ
jgi:hypothetical protein